MFYSIKIQINGKWRILLSQESSEESSTESTKVDDRQQRIKKAVSGVY